MKTSIEKIDDAGHRVLCGMVASLIPHIKWRHNGLGLLQAYAQEGTERELRVHIWCKALQRSGIEDSGLLHDHRFDLESYVLVGDLVQVEYQLTESGVGPWALHEVVHARAAAGAKHAPNDGLVSELPGRYTVEKRSMIVKEGEVYRFPKREFHGTFPQAEYVVTLVEKRNQDDVPARIMAPYGRPVVHAFADPLSEETWQPHLKRAQELLTERWRGDEAFETTPVTVADRS